jgi:hypothetical protein
MGWEERRGRPYYYRSRRLGDRVRKVYIGGGVLGEIAALEDEYRCRRREEEAAYWEEEKERLKQNAAFLQELEEAAKILATAHLLVAGCHKYKGEWRRLREST